MTPSYIKRVKKLHKAVVHNEKEAPAESRLRAEERHIKRIDYNDLSLICKSCFREPK